MNIIKWHCNCSAITFEINPNTIIKSVNCHCNLCRKMNGSAFSSYVVIEENGFKIITGKDKVESYNVSQNATKAFCLVCGTPLYNLNPKQYPGVKILYLGVLETANKIEINANIFCDTQLSWVKEITKIPSFKQTVNSEAIV